MLKLPEWFEDLESFFFESTWVDCECLQGYTDDGCPIKDTSCQECDEGGKYIGTDAFEKAVKDRGGIIRAIGSEDFRDNRSGNFDNLIKDISNKPVICKEICIDRQFIRYLVALPIQNAVLNVLLS